MLRRVPHDLNDIEIAISFQSVWNKRNIRTQLGPMCNTYRQWFDQSVLGYNLSCVCRMRFDCKSVDFVQDCCLKICKTHEWIYWPMTKRIVQILDSHHFDCPLFDWIFQYDMHRYGYPTWTHQSVMLMVAFFICKIPKNFYSLTLFQRQNCLLRWSTRFSAFQWKCRCCRAICLLTKSE